MSTQSGGDRGGVKIISQFRSTIDGEAHQVFKLSLIASSSHLAKMRARVWAREKYPTKRPRDIKTVGHSNKGKAQTRLSDFVPKMAQRNEYEVKIAVR